MHALPIPATGTARRLLPLLLPEDALPQKTSTLAERRAETVGLQGYDLGWDYAHYGVPLPPDLRLELPYVGLGFDEGRIHWRGRTRPADVYVRKWLRLRVSAMQRGRVVHESVTPDFLYSIATTHCPVTRQRLIYPEGNYGSRPHPAVLWSVDRVSNDAGYIAGNVVIMSELANKAKGTLDFVGLYRTAVHLLKTGGTHSGLDGMQWTRLACLAACHLPTEQWRELQALPMVGLPPARVVATNRLIVLQSYVSRMPQLCKKSAGAKAWADCFGRTKLSKLAASFADDFYLAVGAEFSKNPALSPRWHIEDAWMNPVVIKGWRKFCDQLTDADLECARIPREADVQSAQAWGRDSGMGSRGYTN